MYNLHPHRVHPREDPLKGLYCPKHITLYVVLKKQHMTLHDITWYHILFIMLFVTFFR